jgi:tRNA threonylcarbamoyladenosine biosynthesis protein TsaB
MVGAVILVIDTATRTPVLALANDDATLRGERHWQSHHRHGEELLQHLDELLTETGNSRRDLTAVVVGTGPGSFTGLRIGLATAKTIAYALNVPIVGVSSTLALALAAAAGRDDGEIVVTLPAGASDRYVHKIKIRHGLPGATQAPRLVADAQIGPDDVAVDLDSAPSSARQRGESALVGLAAALARLGVAQLASGKSDDVEQLVPSYVALPRGLAKAAAEMEWSPDLR